MQVYTRDKDNIQKWNKYITTDSQQFQNAQQTVTILLITLYYSELSHIIIGKLDSKIVYFGHSSLVLLVKDDLKYHIA